MAKVQEVLTSSQIEALSDRTLKKASGEYRWGPFKLTYVVKPDRVTVTAYIRAFSKDWKIGSATLTAQKTTATLNVEIKHILRASVALRVDFAKRKLEAGFRTCLKDPFKWKCNPKKGHSWRTIVTW